MKKTIYFYLITILLTNFFLLAAKADEIFNLGKDVFMNKAVCSTCHVLADSGSNGQIGPNLNHIRPSKMRVIDVVTNGIGVMPSYQGELTIEEIEAVAHYVSLSSNQ